MALAGDGEGTKDWREASRRWAPATLWAERGRALRGLGAVERAADDGRRAVLCTPLDPEGWAFLGEACRRT